MIESNYIPSHLIWSRIINTVDIIKLINNGKYFECDYPLTDELYELFTNEEYEKSDYSSETYPAKQFLEELKYDGNRFSKEQVLYDYNTQKIIVLYDNCEDLINHSLFPLGALEDIKEETNIKDIETIIIHTR